jgi:integrase
LKAKRSRGSGSLFQPKGSNHWWIQIYADGKRHRESTGTDNKRKAENILRDKIAEVTTGNFNPLSHKVTVAELVKMKYTADSNDGNKSLEDDESRWRLHLQPVYGSMLASRLTTPMLSKFVEGRLAEGARPGTVNRDMSLLRAAFNLGHKSTPPLVVRVPHFPMLEESPARKGFLTDAQYDALGAECMKHGVWLRAIMEIGATFGWRRSEILGLRVRQIDLIAKCVRLDDSKNGEGREVALTSILVQLLGLCIHGKGGDAPVFTWDEAHRYHGKPVRDFRNQWATVTKAAGVPGLYVHDLRRTGARNLRRAGVPESIVMKIGGWKTNDMFRRYAIVDSKDMAEAMRKLEVSREEVRAAAQVNSQRTAKEAPETGQSETRPN